MPVLAMHPSAPHIQSQNHKGQDAQSSTASCPSQSGQMLVTSSPLSPHKRPKLSLQTTSVPVAVGKSSTALSVTMSALAASSPTVRNTFSNAYDLPHRPSPVAASPSSAVKWPKPITSNKSKREDPPYDLPLTLKGILRNAPYIPSLRRSALSATNSASPRSGRRVFFPAVKKVNYRNPLEEVITTIKYTARHSDLSSEEESDSDRSQGSSNGSDVSSSAHTSANTPMTPRLVSPQEQIVKEGGKRPQSPSSKDRKRKRKPRDWRWTLGVPEEEADDRGTACATSPGVPTARPQLSLDTSSASAQTDDEDHEIRKTPYPIEAIKYRGRGDDWPQLPRQ